MLVHQGTGERTVEETLDRGWRVLAEVPESEYRRITRELISRYFSPLLEEGVKTPYY